MLERHIFHLEVFLQKVGANDDVKGSVSKTLQCCITHLSPRQIDTLTLPREWMVHPSPTLMATVVFFLNVFTRRRATMEIVAVVSTTARKT